MQANNTFLMHFIINFFIISSFVVTKIFKETWAMGFVTGTSDVGYYAAIPSTNSNLDFSTQNFAFGGKGNSSYRPIFYNLAQDIEFELTDIRLSKNNSDIKIQKSKVIWPMMAVAISIAIFVATARMALFYWTESKVVRKRIL